MALEVRFSSHTFGRVFGVFGETFGIFITFFCLNQPSFPFIGYFRAEKVKLVISWISIFF